jgi:hypothetical protein
MARALTFGEAIARFGPLVTTGILIEDAIQEAVDRIYEMGRYPGTTVEIELQESDFVRDESLGVWFVFFNEQDYDGAIGFRDQNRGWSIMDQASLYKDGVNAGDREFIDLGSIAQEDGTDERKYRCPLGFDPAGGPYYVLLKKEAPQLQADDLIPIQSVGALKCAVLAVCYEYVNDEERANANWQKFNEFITLSTKQVSGPKKYFIGTDSSLKRRPSQFF